MLHDDGRPLPMPAMAVMQQQMKLHGDSYKAKFCPRIMWTKEDPVVTGSTDPQLNATAHLAELLIAPSLNLLPLPSVAGSLSQHHVADDGAFHMALVPPSSLGSGYVDLVHTIADRVGAEIGKRMRSGASPDLHANEGTEQIIPLVSAADSKSMLARGRRTLRNDYAQIATLLQQHIEPYLAQHVLNGRTAELRLFRISRNMVPPSETLRLRANTWHWDTGPVQPDRWIKVLLYLTDADSNSGCMMVVRHNRTGATFKMDGKKIWGPMAAPASVPREWLAEMFWDGYRPECLGGKAGSMVIFDTNIVHRGSRPAMGRHRDAINFEFVLGVNKASKSTRGRRTVQGVPEPAQQSLPQELPPSQAVEGLIATLKGSAKLLPAVGFGTANRKSAQGEPLVRSLVDFFQLGGRHIDTASMYRNGAEIKEALVRSRVPRDEVWITSKLNTIRHLSRLGGFVNSSDGVAGAVESITGAMGTYVDLLLIHDPNELTPSERIDVWRGMLAARNGGAALVRQVGVSNFNKVQLEELESATGVLPVANEIEFHPWVSQATFDIAQWCLTKGIAVVAYNSLGGKKNQARGKVIAQIAAKHRVSNAQVLLRWSLQQGVRVIPGATSRAHIQQNLNLSCFQLPSDDMALMRGSSKPRTFAKYSSGVNG